jgi:hypothetical protein
MPGLQRLQKLMDEYAGGVTVQYMTNDKVACEPITYGSDVVNSGLMYLGSMSVAAHNTA